MDRKIEIIPEGVCATAILVETRDGVIRDLTFENGCDGNGKAVGRLLKGMPVEKAVLLLTGGDCEGRGTSCAEQLARGLRRQLLPE